MIASTQITNAEVFAFIDVQVYKLLVLKVLFINRKDNRNFRILLKHVNDHLSLLFLFL